MTFEQNDLVVANQNAQASSPAHMRIDGFGNDRSRERVRRRVEIALVELSNRSSVDVGAITGVDREFDEVDVGLSMPYRAERVQHDREAAVKSGIISELSTDHSGPIRGCVCRSEIPGHEILWSDDSLIWRDRYGGFIDPPEGRDSWRIAMPEMDPSGDGVGLRISRGEYSDNAVRIGLGNSTEWAKEIWSFNLCSGRGQAVQRGGYDRNFSRMLLTPASCRTGTDTVVFRKPGMFGIWTDMAHWNVGLFWRAFANTNVDIIWVIG